MYNFINNLTSDNLILLSKQYCNIDFTKEEIEPILPFLKNIYLEYYQKPEKRNIYLDQLKEKTNSETYNKIIILLNKFKLI